MAKGDYRRPDPEVKETTRNKRRNTLRRNAKDEATEALESAVGEAKVQMGVYGNPSQSTDPAEILIQEIQRTDGHVQWLTWQLSRQAPEEFVHSLWLARRASGFVSNREWDLWKEAAAGSIWLDLYMAERRHLSQILRTALAAGIEERRLKFAERMAERISETIVGVLEEVGIDTEDDGVRSIIHRHLVNASADVQDTVLSPRKSALPLESDLKE